MKDRHKSTTVLTVRLPKEDDQELKDWADLEAEVTGAGWTMAEWEKLVLRLSKADWYKMGQDAAKARVRWGEYTDAQELAQGVPDGT